MESGAETHPEAQDSGMNPDSDTPPTISPFVWQHTFFRNMAVTQEASKVMAYFKAIVPLKNNAPF